jgi:hypothetical protein
MRNCCGCFISFYWVCTWCLPMGLLLHSIIDALVHFGWWVLLGFAVRLEYPVLLILHSTGKYHNLCPLFYCVWWEEWCTVWFFCELYVCSILDGFWWMWCMLLFMVRECLIISRALVSCTSMLMAMCGELLSQLRLMPKYVLPVQSSVI